MNDIKSEKTDPRAGLFAVILGPDGSGKSTVVARLLAESITSYNGSWCFHWRPGLLPQPGRRTKKKAASASLPPPNEFAYGRTISLLRYCYFLADFVLGYWLIIYPRRIRGQLVLGERWYFDVLINPQRYGFRLPQWLLHFGGRLIPSPDLTVLLTADPDAIYNRKPELTVEQITTQITAMRDILPRNPHGAEIPTDIALDESVATLLALLRETSERLRGIDGWRAFPRFGNAKVLIADRDPARVALQLYNPYSLAGRIAKRLAGFLPRVLTTRPLTSADRRDGLRVISRLIRVTMEHDDLSISFATGTPGPHRKMTAQVRHKGRVAAYVKVAQSDAVIELLKREADALNNLNLRTGGRVATPRVIAETDQDRYHLLFLSAPEVMSRARPLEFDELDVTFLEAMVPAEPKLMSLDAVWQNLSADRHQDDDIVRASRSLLDLLAGTTGIRVAPAHGDYAPWNTLHLTNNQLFVFDWEYFNHSTPILGDMFQRVFMPDWLVHHLPPLDATNKLIGLRSDPLLQGLIQRLEIEENEFIACVLLYLLRQGFRNTENHGIPDYIQSCLRVVITHSKILTTRKTS